MIINDEISNLQKLEQLQEDLENRHKWVAVDSDADSIFSLLFQFVNIVNGLQSEIVLLNNNLTKMENMIKDLEDKL